MNVNPEIHDPLMGFDKGWAWLRWKRVWHIVMAVALYVLYGLAVFAAVWLLCSCSPKVVTVPEVHTEYIVRTDTFISRDSIVRNDSVIIRMQGDTVTVERWHTKMVDRWRDRVVRDTMIRCDSVSVPYPVEKKLTRWQQVKIRLTDYILIAALILSMLYLLLRWLRRRSQH